MSYLRTYKGVVFTNHALERLKSRKMSQHQSWKAIAFADEKRKGKKTDSYEFIKKDGNHTVTVVAKRTDKNEWLVVSSWIDPPLKGSIDLSIKKESLWSRFLNYIFGKLK